MKAAEEAVRYLKSGSHTRGDMAGEGECLRMFLDADQGDRDRRVYGGVVAELLRNRNSGGGRIGAREVLAERIRDEMAHSGREGLETVLEKMWSCGGSAMEGLVSVLVDDELWPEREKEKKQRSEVLWVCFKWSVLRVEKHGDEEGVKAGLRAISRMLMAKAEDLHHLMSSTVFEQILLAVSRGGGEVGGVVAGEGEWDKELATQATLAAAKYVSAAGAVGESQFANFMTQKLVVSEDEKDTIVAMEAATAIFPLIQQVSAGMFTETKGFIGRLVEVLDEGERPSGTRNTKHRAEAVRAVVRLLAVACGDRGCRGVIKQSCGDYLERIIARGGGGKRENDTRTLAAVALAKIRSAGPGDDAALGTRPNPVVDKEGIGELARIFKASLILQSNTSMASVSQRESIEGLAYTSLDPSVKQTLVTDRTFVTALLKILATPTAPSCGVLYGGLTVLANITTYPPLLTEEQRKVLKLKNYAEASPNAHTPESDTDPLETDEAVTLRCKRLLDADIIPVLVTIFKNISQSSSSTTGTPTNASSSLLLIPKIILSLSKTQKHRPPMAQQGAIKLLLQIYSSAKTSPAKQQQPSSFSSLSPDSSRLSEIKYFAAHALARVLVSVNPTLVFSSQTPPVTAIRPLLDLLNSRYDDKQPAAAALSRGPGAMTDLLPTFEALLALTNLASMPGDKTGPGGVQDLIVRVGWDHLEDLLLMHAPMSSSSALRTTQTEDSASSSGDDAEEAGTSPGGSKSGGEHTKSNLDDGQKAKSKLKPKKTIDSADASTRIQRAAVELICNLCGSYSPLALAKFAAEPQSDPRVAGRLHLLLALADATDYPTRRAAAGTLAVLTEFATVVQGVLDRERGVKVVLGMLRDEEDQGDEMALRGVVCVTNMLEVGGEKAMERVKVEGGKEALVGAVNRARGRELVEFGVKAISVLR